MGLQPVDIDSIGTRTPSSGPSRPRIGIYVLRRIVAAPIILLGVSLTVFVAVDLSPNDPATARLGVFADPEMRERFALEHGLNDPLPVRFWRFLVDLTHLNLGESVIRPETINELIRQALPVTIQLMIVSILLAVLISLPLGIVSAWSEGRTPDRLIGVVTAILQASPQFWLGLLFIQLLAVELGILPSGGYVPLSSGFAGWFSSIIGPSIVLATPIAAALTRVIRGSVSDELAKDYVNTAIGSGLPKPVVLLRNVLRNALIAPITVLGLFIGALMSGAILIEVVFNLPGMGTLLVTGVAQGDLGAVRGVAIVGAASFVLVNLVVDILYVVIDPRSAEARA